MEDARGKQKPDGKSRGGGQREEGRRRRAFFRLILKGVAKTGLSFTWDMNFQLSE